MPADTLERPTITTKSPVITGLAGQTDAKEQGQYREMGAPFPPPPIKIVRMRVNTAAFREWMQERVLDDREYAVHSLLSEVFGSMQPRPFRIMFNDRARSRHGAIMGYVRNSADELRQSLNEFADPLHAMVLSEEHIVVKDMPNTWKPGRRLGFEIRIRPTIKADRLHPVPDLRGERDAWAVIDSREPGVYTRESVYARWLAHLMRRRDAAVVDERSCRLVTFKVSQNRRKLRNKQLGDRLSPEDAFNPDQLWHSTYGPDAVMRGTLTVTNPAAFTNLLHRGVGRHVPYGYGMLLLRPL